MDILIHESAGKFLGNLDKKTQQSIKADLKKLSEGPYSKQLDTKKLKGQASKPDIFRLRVGEYRVIYFIKEGKIMITEIMKREKGYDMKGTF